MSNKKKIKKKVERINIDTKVIKETVEVLDGLLSQVADRKDQAAANYLQEFVNAIKDFYKGKEEHKNPLMLAALFVEAMPTEHELDWIAARISHAMMGVAHTLSGEIQSNFLGLVTNHNLREYQAKAEEVNTESEVN